MSALLEIRDLAVTIPTADADVQALRGVSLSVAPNEVVGIVGESGGGTSMIARAVIHMLPAAARMTGEIVLEGRDVSRLDGDALQAFRGGDVALCFQSPRSALSPTRTVGKQMFDRFRAHSPGGDLSARAVEAFRAVGLREPEHQLNRFPHELSGGMCQRVMIALALACAPRVLIADEPTTGLDVTLTGEILDLIAAQARDGRGVMIISHDIAALSKVCHRLIVIEAGRIVEDGPTREVIGAPKHDYTRRLIAAVPDVREKRAVAVDKLGETLMLLSDVGVSYQGRFGRSRKPALVGVHLEIRKGDTIAIVGESGSGKSTLSRTIMGMLKPTTGRVTFRGTDIARLSSWRIRGMRRHMQMVYQDPLDALNPRMSVEDIVSDPLRLVERDAARRSALIDRALTEVGLDPSFRKRFPNELSGGQAQRVGLARALAIDPDLVVLDEPTSALDVTVQAQILSLIRRLTERRDRAYVIVSHDLATVRALSDRVVVVDAGRIVEEGPTEKIFTDPVSSKTRALLDAVPYLVKDRRK